MNPLLRYEPWGAQATATVTFGDAPIDGATITVNGTVYTKGTDFIGKNRFELADAFAAAVNADRARQHTSPTATNPVGPVQAMFYGAVVRLIAVVPGTVGNDLTLARNLNSGPAHITVSGATFTGGQDGQTIDITVGDLTIGTIKLEDGDSSAKLDIGSDGAGKNAAYVQAQALPLPTGASTSALQTTGNTSLASIVTAVGLLSKPADQQHVIIDSGLAAIATAAKQDTGNTSIAAVSTALGAKADAEASDDSGTFSLISLFKRLLAGVATIIARQSWSVTQPAGTVVSSSDYETGHQLIAGPGTLLSLTGYSNAATAQFIQLFDSLVEPADNDVPVFIAKVLVTSNIPALDVAGMHFAVGCWVKNSSDGNQLQAGDADCFFSARVLAD